MKTLLFSLAALCALGQTPFGGGGFGGSGGGGSNCPQGTSGQIQKYSAANTCAASVITDNGSTVASTLPITAPSATFGTSGTGVVTLLNGAAPSAPASGNTSLFVDSNGLVTSETSAGNSAQLKTTWLMSDRGGVAADQIFLGNITPGDGQPGIWFGANATAPSTSNYSIIYSGGQTQIGSPTSSSVVITANSGGQSLTVGCFNAASCFSGPLFINGTGSYLQWPQTNVSQLTACSAGRKGSMEVVWDASAPAWGSTVSGGGSVLVMVLCDGTNWVVR